VTHPAALRAVRPGHYATAEFLGNTRRTPIYHCDCGYVAVSYYQETHAGLAKFTNPGGMRPAHAFYSDDAGRAGLRMPSLSWDLCRKDSGPNRSHCVRDRHECRLRRAFVAAYGAKEPKRQRVLASLGTLDRISRWTTLLIPVRVARAALDKGTPHICRPRNTIQCRAGSRPRPQSLTDRRSRRGARARFGWTIREVPN